MEKAQCNIGEFVQMNPTYFSSPQKLQTFVSHILKANIFLAKNNIVHFVSSLENILVFIGPVFKIGGSTFIRASAEKNDAATLLFEDSILTPEERKYWSTDIRRIAVYVFGIMILKVSGALPLILTKPKTLWPDKEIKRAIEILRKRNPTDDFINRLCEALTKMTSSEEVDRPLFTDLQALS